MKREGLHCRPKNLRARRPDFLLRPFLGALLLMFFCGACHGQSLPSLDFTGRSGEKRPELLEKTTPATPPTVTLPPLPSPAKGPAGMPMKSVMVRKIVVTGNTAFTAEEIGRVTAPFENRTLTMEDLETLRRDLTLLYVNKGYINSGAVIPDQSVTDGQITLQIIEGKVANVEVEGNRWFTKSYLRNRVGLSTGVPVNIQPLQDRLQLLQQDPRIQRIHAELRPGAALGESELRVQVEEKPPISLWLAYNNYQSPSVGAERGLATLAHQNLTGHGDVLSFTYGYSRGLNPLLDTWYAVPINAYDTTLQFRYRKNDSKVVDQVFGPLDIISKSESFELALRQPVYRTLSQEFTLSISAEHERTETSLAGEPFSFSPGVENGKSVVVPIRFAQEWTYRTQRQVIAARSRFSFGLDTWDATIHSGQNAPDGQFFAWLGQLQYARILDFLDIQLLSRADVQLSHDPLLPVEQFGVGGRYSVRGYRENMLVKDQAFIASLEARIPLVQNKGWAEYFQVSPFFDYGWGDSVDRPDSGPKDLSSLGLGLRWGAALFKLPLNLRADAEVYWGYRLRPLDLPHEDLQDDGIHYQIAITGFF